MIVNVCSVGNEHSSLLKPDGADHMNEMWNTSFQWWQDPPLAPFSALINNSGSLLPLLSIKDRQTCSVWLGARGGCWLPYELHLIFSRRQDFTHLPLAFRLAPPSWGSNWSSNRCHCPLKPASSLYLTDSAELLSLSIIRCFCLGI